MGGCEAGQHSGDPEEVIPRPTRIRIFNRGRADVSRGNKGANPSSNLLFSPRSLLRARRVSFLLDP